ncbi:tetratricopeptide repeat protein [Amycolatopsis lexingtonensis]|uniref:tetratricopeptide repeat protein n=1 Tax=Amycolatopsis lexingtonensis TaxID=218822 RepID=UPI003F730245
MSLQDLIRRRQAGGFVGRREELGQFQDNLRLPVDDVRRQFLFSIHGDAGIGKTFLLRQFTRLARESGCLTAYVDESVYDIPAALEAISAGLAQQDAPCKELGKRSETYRKHQYELDSDPAAPEGLSSALMRSAVRIGLRAAEDIPLVGPFAKELNTDAVAGQVDRLRSYLSGKLRNHHDVRLMLSPVEVLTPLFVADIGEIAAERPIVLFFDTYERTGVFLDAWLRSLLSGHYGDLPANLVLVVAGQHPLDVNTWGDYLGIRSNIALQVFTEAEAVELLAAKGVADKAVVDVVLGLTGRLPVLVAMLAEARPGNVEDISDPSDNAVERFLKWESDPRRREAAVLGALPRRLDKETYAAVTGSDADFGWLLGLPFVAERSGGYRYHDVVRQAMLRVQRRRSSTDWGTRHEKLAEHYRAAAEAAELTGAWKDERFQAMALEEHYHRLCAQPSAAVPAALMALVDTLDRNSEFVPRWTSMLRQAGVDSGTAALARRGEELASLHAGDRVEFCTRLAEDPSLDDRHRALAYGERGREQWHREEYEEALSDLSHAIDIDESRRWFRAHRGEVYRLMNRHDEALADLSRVVEAHPRYGWALTRRAVTYRSMGRYTEALADYDRAAALNPGTAWILGLRGDLHRLAGRPDAAITDLNRALEIDPEIAWAYAHRGAVHRAEGRPAEALADYDRALRIDPEYAWALAERGGLAPVWRTPLIRGASSWKGCPSSWNPWPRRSPEPGNGLGGYSRLSSKPRSSGWCNGASGPCRRWSGTSS